ncbi:polyubiquitin-like [Carex rostrata]
MKPEDQSKRNLPRIEIDGKRQRMKSDDQSKKIFVKMTKTMAIDVKNTDTIDAVKTKVQDMEGTASSKQELFFDGTYLIGTQTVKYYNIPTNSCIDVYVKDACAITISIQTLTNSFSLLNMKTSDTISDIKSMIHDKRGIPSDQQTLIFSGKVLDEDQTLASCGVHNNAILQMLTRPSSTLHVTVKFIQGSPINLEVQNWYTIAELKLMIGLPQGGQLKLFFSDQELDDNQTLRDYRINDYAVLEVKPALIKIFVKTPDWKPVVMNVGAYERLSDVAVRIGERLDLDLNEFAILFNERYLFNNNCMISEMGIELNELLNSDSTVEESGIVDGSTLRLLPVENEDA